MPDLYFKKERERVLDVKTIHSFISVILNRYNEILSITLCKCEKDGENKVENIPGIKITLLLKDV